MSRAWNEYFMEMAELVASKSKDPATKVGCVIVASDQVVAATGYNGIPRGVEDKPERMERPAKYLWTSHAEENAVAHAARTGVSLKGSTAFVTHKPCCRCARMLIQAGVVEVVVGDGTTSMPIEEFHTSDVMLKEAGVKVTDLLTDV